MLYSETIDVCSQIHTKHINALCGQNVELLNVKPGGTYRYHWVVKGSSGTALRMSECRGSTAFPIWNT
jgi:hypothetical protein